MGLGRKPEKEFQHHVTGTWGSFTTPAGKVDYLLTKARLGKESTDPERRLTSNLAPVREVLQSEDLDFNQLLQRDLDDHRVAVNLIPYLLTKDPAGPAFFPPIVAVLLPFETMSPSEFDSLGKLELVDDELKWEQQDAGEQVRIRRLAHDDGSRHAFKVGQLWWNDEYARLVVLDGQHRAMALLAIDRTLRKAWQGSGGERYRFFYESRVMELLANKDFDLEEIEVPVAITWLPDLFGPQKYPHVAARKLFVDVNREARQPSESRLILLSDGELLNIFTRSLLSELRNDKDRELLPLFSVEYDNPELRPTQSARWSALTNIHILQQMVKRLIFGPPKYLLDVEQKIGRREPQAEMDAFMRSQLALGAQVNEENIPPVLMDDGVAYQRDQLGNTNFPLGSKELLESRFANTWGFAILRILTKLAPYAAHADALASLKKEWMSADAVDNLAYEALFGGVGMYWTLRDSADHYRTQLASLLEDKPAKPDTVRAWELVLSKQKDFEAKRSLSYLKSAAPDRVKASNLVFQMFNTQACQVGLALTLGTVWITGVSLTTELDKLPEFSDKFVEAINAWLTSKVTGTYDRRLFLTKEGVSKPLNALASLDTPRAVEFRYFWLEVLASEDSLSILDSHINVDSLARQRDKARQQYLNYLRDQNAHSLKITSPTQDVEARQREAMDNARKSLRSALGVWFDVSGHDFDSWYDTHLDGPDESGNTGSQVIEAAVVGDSDDEDLEVETTVSIEDLIEPE